MTLAGGELTASLVITRKSGERCTVLVDAVDLQAVLAAGPWNIHTDKKRDRRYVVRNLSGGRTGETRLHRFLMNPGKLMVDHKNLDGLDNRRENLRVATNGQNVANTPVRKCSASGLKGVQKCRAGKKWAAKITSNNKTTFLGCYDTPWAAHAAYCKAAVVAHGEFARTK